MRKVGLLVGREWSWPPRFIDEVNRRADGVTAEYVKLGGTRMGGAVGYDVIIDRISHEVPYYRTFLKHAALQGVTVINDPFMWTADDKFFEASLAVKLGIAHPKTAALPNKDYVPGIVHAESLRNLEYPLDWRGLLEYVGLPCVLKDAHGGGWKNVAICRTEEELWRAYDESGLLTMVLQEFIDFESEGYFRCLCLGQEDVLVMKYDPKQRRYLPDEDHNGTPLGERIVKDTRTLMRALGYDMCSLEWAVRGGVPYAIDFMNPAPDMDVNSLTPKYFEWAVTRMADLAIRRAKGPREERELVSGRLI
ncbi:MAG: ATP-grasp domain-containing protein [Gemmataceae bacterium]